MTDPTNIVAELRRVAVLFQARAIAAQLGAPPGVLDGFAIKAEPSMRPGSMPVVVYQPSERS